MTSRSLALIASLLQASALTASLQAQTGLLLVAHGAGPEWNDPVRDLSGQVGWPHGPVAVAFLMGPEAETSGWDRGVARLTAAGARRIIAVPLMVSSYGSHYRQVEYYAGLRDRIPPELSGHSHGSPSGPGQLPIAVTPALDDAPELGVALALRWQKLSEADRARSVVLIAHGPSDEREITAWIRNLSAVAQVLRPAGLGSEPRVALLRDDAEPEVRRAAVLALRDTITALAGATGDSVVVMPVLISSSRLSTVRVPADLAGLPVRYSRLPLAPLPPLARWIERVAHQRLDTPEVARTE